MSKRKTIVRLTITNQEPLGHSHTSWSGEYEIVIAGTRDGRMLYTLSPGVPIESITFEGVNPLLVAARNPEAWSLMMLDLERGKS